MSIKTINGDITNAPVGTLICHQVNCQGVMGAGVALAIARKWPEVEQQYATWVQNERISGTNMLGSVQCVPTKDGRTVANMFAQNDLGCSARQTNYEAFYRCLTDIRFRAPHDLPIAFPFMIGCGLGGGDWRIILSMIAATLEARDVTLYKFS